MHLTSLITDGLRLWVRLTEGRAERILVVQRASRNPEPVCTRADPTKGAPGYDSVESGRRRGRPTTTVYATTFPVVLDESSESRVTQRSPQSRDAKGESIRCATTPCLLQAWNRTTTLLLPHEPLRRRRRCPTHALIPKLSAIAITALATKTSTTHHPHPRPYPPPVTLRRELPTSTLSDSSTPRDRNRIFARSADRTESPTFFLGSPYISVSATAFLASML